MVKNISPKLNLSIKDATLEDWSECERGIVVSANNICVAQTPVCSKSNTNQKANCGIVSNVTRAHVSGRHLHPEDSNTIEHPERQTASNQQH